MGSEAKCLIASVNCSLAKVANNGMVCYRDEHGKASEGHALKFMTPILHSSFEELDAVIIDKWLLT